MQRISILSFFSVFVFVFVIGSTVLFAQTGDNRPPQQQEAGDSGQERGAANPSDSATTEQDKEARVGKSLEQKYSYLIGYQIMSSMKKDGVTIDIETLINGLRDAQQDMELPMSMEEAQSVDMAMQRKVMDQRKKMFDEIAEKNRQEGEEFLSANAQQEGVQVLESGLQIKLLEEGTGKKLEEGDRIRFHYTGTFPNGEEFDSSVGGEPLSYRVGDPGLIPGMMEAISKMRVGDRWKIFMPGELGYGEQGSPPIGPSQALIFEVEIAELVQD